MSKRIRNFIAVASAIAVPLMAAPMASADGEIITPAGVTSCPSDGNPGGGQRCTKIGNGILSVRKAGNTYFTTNYYRQDGGALTARNGVERSGTNHWAAFRNMGTVPFHYDNSWTLSASCSAVTGKLNTSGGDTYPTPPLPAC
ncbi:hypothetical protein ACWG5P_32470 [Streptomyces prasinus]